MGGDLLASLGGFELAGGAVDHLECGFMAELVAGEKRDVFADPAPAQAGFSGTILEGLGATCAGDVVEGFGFCHVPAVQQSGFTRGGVIAQRAFARFAAFKICCCQDRCREKFLIRFSGDDLGLGGAEFWGVAGKGWCGQAKGKGKDNVFHLRRIGAGVKCEKEKCVDLVV